MVRTHSRTLFPLAAVVLWSCLPEKAAGNPVIYKRAMQSVAFIISPRAGNKSVLGTGFLANEREKIVVTNYHVVGDEDKVMVVFPVYRANELVTDAKYYSKNFAKLGVQGKVIARSKKQDLALIKVPSFPRGIIEIRYAQHSPKPGETLHAVGNSSVELGMLWRYSKGEVRQVWHRKFKSFAQDKKTSVEIDAKMVETQMPINGGDSGGAVLNDRGELAAVVQSGQDARQLVSYLIDISEVRDLLKKHKYLPEKKSNKKP
jgi:serine protease Do